MSRHHAESALLAFIDVEDFPAIADPSTWAIPRVLVEPTTWRALFRCAFDVDLEPLKISRPQIRPRVPCVQCGEPAPATGRSPRCFACQARPKPPWVLRGVPGHCWRLVRKMDREKEVLEETQARVVALVGRPDDLVAYAIRLIDDGLARIQAASAAEQRLVRETLTGRAS